MPRNRNVQNDSRKIEVTRMCIRGSVTQNPGYVQLLRVNKNCAKL
jgi:hypothetical protein